jgi:hypothetical protein
LRRIRTWTWTWTWTSLLVLAASATVAAAQGAGAAAEPEAPAPAAADPDAPTVTARLDRAEAHVGDPLLLVVTAISRRELSVNLPSTLDLGKQLSLLDRAEALQDLGDGRVRRDFTLKVAAYEPGALEVPALELTYLGKDGQVRTAKTSPVALKITSLIANEPEPALKESAAPVPVWKRDLTLVYVAGAVLAAGLGALVTFLVVRRLRRRVLVRPGPPPRPAHEVALERLDRLGAYGFLENADNRPFYFAVSEVIRDYLGARFGFDSLELTTDELMAELRQRAERELVLGEIDGWLSGCDLVKFAKVSPSAAEARGTLEIAIRIVESTRPRPDPQATAAVAGAVGAGAGAGTGASAGSRATRSRGAARG